MAKKIEHIAVMRLSAMGDVAMTVPVLRAFARQHPKVKITVVSRLFFQPLFDGIPNIFFFAFDQNKRHKGILGLVKLFFDIKAIKIDAFADLHDVLRSKFVRVLISSSGIKTVKVDKGRAEKASLTRANNKIFRPIKSMFARHCEVFEKLGFSVDLNNPVFPEKSTLPADIRSLIGEDNFKIIGIAPFAQHQAKVYPIDLMQELIDKLCQNKSNKILLFGGGAAEIKQLELLARKKENCIVVAGKINLRQELQLISHLDVMLSMDSANGHLAAIQGIKTISLWGATHPFAGFGPFHQPLENSLVCNRDLYPKIPTSIYGNKIVKGYENAMRSISVETILLKIYSCLDDNYN